MVYYIQKMSRFRRKRRGTAADVSGRGTVMDNKYTKMSKAFKALSDPKRIRIVDMLSCGEMCACMLLKCFEVTQPTLAHDMKVLTEANIVTSRREGKKTIYSLNWAALKRMNAIMIRVLEHGPEGSQQA